MTTSIVALITELQSAAATLRTPTGTLVPAQDRITAELIERAAGALAAAQRAPLPATAVEAEVMVSSEGPETLWIFLDPITANVVGYSEVGPEHARPGERTVVYRRVALANPPAPSWLDAPAGYDYRAMDSDGSWWWFKNRPYTETFGSHDGWDCDDGLLQARGPTIYPNWKDTLQARPEVVHG